MEKAQVICFHNPDEENGYLSNWYISPFRKPLGYEAGKEFLSVEHFFMYMKAKWFGDDAIAEKILKTEDVSEVKHLGRQVKNFNEHIWNGMRQTFMMDGIHAKFCSDPRLQEKLVSTGNALIAECAVQDRIWGIGLSMHDPKRLDPKEWKGQNLLGYLLMNMRMRIVDYLIGTLPLESYKE